MKTLGDALAELNALQMRGDDDALRQKIGDMLLGCRHARLRSSTPPAAVLKAEALCLRLLRESDNRRGAGKQSCTFFGCDLRAFLEHASLCADVLLSDARRNLFFWGEPLLCGAAPTELLQGYLNLVSNALLYSTGDVVTSLTQTDTTATLSVESDCGAPLPASFHTGLQCAANAARLHGGRLLLSSSPGRFRAVMLVSKTLPWETLFTPPLFSQYLEERVSPVRIALCQVL